MNALSKRRPILLLLALLCLPCGARAQEAGGSSVKMSAEVSETVALSVPQAAGASGVRVSTGRNADGSLNIRIDGSTRALTEVSIPVQIRSNTAYRLFAAAKSGGPSLSSLLVVGARPTGNLVAHAAEAVSVSAPFDGRGVLNSSTPAGGPARPDFYALSELLSGPRVSTGGTLASPQNALEVTLSLSVEPQPGGQGWTVELLLSAEPAARPL